MFTGDNGVLLSCVVLYLLVSIGIGFYAARRVKNSTDYMVAGRSLPIYMVTATVFATWFGSETVLGTSSTFIAEGLGGIVADPFGAALCLILVGLFFAVPLYRMKLLTIGDYYRLRYGRDVELVTSLVIMLSYLGWVAAQMMALGLVFSVLTDGAISREMGTVIGALIVISYTLYGGMWSVALTDFFQMTLIMVGLLFIAWFITGQIDGGAMAVLQHAEAQGKMNILPEGNLVAVLGFIAALMTLGLGSIPQQDVFQRVMAAKNEKVARNGAIFGGLLYLLFAFIPIYLAYTAFFIDPDMITRQLADGGDSEMVLPSLILNHTPLFSQILFFGALLSAIMSTASGTLLAPSVLVGNNMIKPLFPNLPDHQFLWVIRGVVLLFGSCVLLFAFHSELTIFQMVESAYQVVLVGAFVPLAFGLYWKRANHNGARLAIAAGVLVWQLLPVLSPSAAAICPPELAGFVASVMGMIIGSLWLPNDRVKPMMQA